MRGDLFNQSRGLLFQKFKATRIRNKEIGALDFFFEGHLLLTALLDLRFCVSSDNHTVGDYIRRARYTDG